MGRNAITRRFFAAVSRYRPRVLTLAVLAAIAAIIWLANLTEEYSPRKVTKTPVKLADLRFDLSEPGEVQNGAGYWNLSSGWPLRWRQCVIVFGYGAAVVGECISAGRLSGNVAIWLIMLAAPAGVCERLMRRYRPRIRYSLRTMLAATGLTAAVLGWFAVARNRANMQDRLTDFVKAHNGRVWVDRWGPGWLEPFGVDRYCRRVVGVQLHVWGAAEDKREGRRLLGELKRLPHLRYLSLGADRLTPEIADALRELRGLESLRIVVSELTADSGQALRRALGGMPRLRALDLSASPVTRTDHGAFENCLAVIGKQLRLERLRLKGWGFEGREFALLGGLANLKSLSLEDTLAGPDQYVAPDPPLLSHLPALPRLESLDLGGSLIGDGDLPFVAALPRLKALNLSATDVTGAGLAELAPLECLEELTIGAEAQSPAGCNALLRLKRLKKVHFSYVDEKLFLQLREAMHGLAIDTGGDPIRWDEQRTLPKDETNLKGPLGHPFDGWARQAVRAWKVKQKSQ